MIALNAGTAVAKLVLYHQPGSDTGFTVYDLPSSAELLNHLHCPLGSSFLSVRGQRFFSRCGSDWPPMLLATAIYPSSSYYCVIPGVSVQVAW